MKKTLEPSLLKMLHAGPVKAAAPEEEEDEVVIVKPSDSASNITGEDEESSANSRIQLIGMNVR